MIAFVVAMDQKGLIGKDGALPWHYPKDLAFFKSLTLNERVLMGRKTYDAILKQLGRPLPRRENIVLTTQAKRFEGAKVIHDLPAYLETIPKDMNLFVIGGKTVFEAAMPYVDKLYITHIQKTFEGDTYFPKLDYSQFNLIDKKIDGDLIFATYRRKEKPL